MILVSPIQRRVRRVFYGWWIVAGAFIAQALSAGLLYRPFGAYLVALQSEFGWSRGLISGAYSLSQMESAFLGPVQGWLFTRFGPRPIMRIGVVLFGGGFILLGLVHSLIAYYAVFLLIAMGSSTSGYLLLNSTVANWFVRMRTQAMSLLVMGLSLGGLATPLVAWSIGAYGWRFTAVVSGVLIVVVGLLVAQLMRTFPEQYGYLPDGDPPPQQAKDGAGSSRSRLVGQPGVRMELEGYTLGEALRTGTFWLLAAGSGLALVTNAAVNVHLIPHLTESLGMSVQSAAGIVSILTIIVLFSQFVGGVFGDRFSKRGVIAISLFFQALAMLLLAMADSLVMVFVFVAVYGAAWGVRGPVMTAIRADYFGRRSFATIMGFNSLFSTMGSVVGPTAVGFMADWRGDYRLAFAGLALLSLVSSLCLAFARPPQPPRRRQTQSQ